MATRDEHDPAALAARARMMAGELRHRGPDEDGWFAAEHVALASRRLKVIDLETGRMPLTNESGDVVVVYNGEIYNHRELRDELKRAGHDFSTKSDTEVLVHLYEQHGIEMVYRLNGMFAFALWDARARCLHLVRDRLGIKPLFYKREPGRLLFGSELKCLVEGASGELEIDIDGLIDYLALGYIRAPRSIYGGCAKLPPGCRLEYRDGEATIHRYWEYPRRESREFGDPEEAADALEAHLRSSVRKRLVADVPVGSFLSGGLDSSLVVAFASEAATHPLKTFSVGYEGEKSELPHARRVARYFGTDHHELSVEPDCWSLIENLVEYFDEPFGDSSCLPTYEVSKLARKHVTVALSGDGGDELFGGYDRYAFDARWSWVDSVPQWIRRAVFAAPVRLASPSSYGWNLLRALAASRGERYALHVAAELNPYRGGLVHPRWLDHVPDPEALFRDAYRNASELPWPARLMYADATTYLPDDILTKVDRMSMAHSLEARVPLLDHEFVEFAAALPASWKIRGGERKWLLRRVAERHLPDEILRKPKQGFSIPLDRWLRQDLAPMLSELLNSEARTRAYLYHPTVERLVNEHVDGRRDHSGVLWRLVVLEVWLRNREDRHASFSEAVRRGAIRAAGPNVSGVKQERS